MNLSHFTSKPLGQIRSVEQKPIYDSWSTYCKPRGLWVSVDGDDDWAAWCEQNDFGIGRDRYRITLASLERVLILPTEAAILAFTKNYGRDDGRIYSRPAIHWDLVAADYAGIIVAPYCWSLRFEERTSWYYGWDCASGCIWDASIISNVVMIGAAEAA